MCSNSKILIVATMLLLLFMGKNHAQQAATVPYGCDFENSSENSQWTFANSTVNEWYIGTPGHYSGSNGLFVSGFQGSNAQYYQRDSSNCYAYRRIHLDAGLYNVSFDWSFLGAYTNYIVYSYMRVFLIPVSANLTGGQRYPGLTASRVPPNAIPVDFSGAQPVWDDSWNHFVNPMVRIPTTGDYNLVFFFFCTNFAPGNESEGVAPKIDNVSVTAVSCPKPYALTYTNRGNGCIRLDWEDAQVPTPTDWVVEYGPRGFQPGNGTQANTTRKPYDICGLQVDTLYDFYVQARCIDGSWSPYSKPLRMKYSIDRHNCRDFSDLKSLGTVCTYGQFEEFGDTIGEFFGPYSDTGIVNFGSSRYGDPNTMMNGSRHTVHYDPFEYDSCSGGQLTTVPPGGSYSVRLGCVYGKWICQSVSYQITIDSNTADLLQLKYSAVLYNPDGHSSYRKPRFILELLDANNNLIDPTCGFIDFTATNAVSDSTWHPGSEPSTYWKQWTTVGVNVGNYHGQTITARLTTYACGQGAPAHYGYAYYNLDCYKARLRGMYCASDGQASKAMLIAPAGFNYRWTSPDKPGFESNDRIIYVDVDSAVYNCDLTFLTNDRCGYSQKIIASPQNLEGTFSHADFTYQKDSSNCEYHVLFTSGAYSSSTQTSDTLHNCDFFYWDFGDSTSSNLENPPLHQYPDYGTYTVMHIAGSDSLNCYDTVYKTITFQPPEKFQFVGDSIACRGKFYTISVAGTTATFFQWNTGDSTNSVTRRMTMPFNFQVHVKDHRGCETDLSKLVTVDSVPAPQFDTIYFAYCNPLTVSLLDKNPRAGQNKYLWLWGDGDTTFTDSNIRVEHSYTIPGNYNIQCFIWSTTGFCRDTVEPKAFSFDYTKAAFSWEPTIGRVYAPTMRFINRSRLHEPEMNTYVWKFFNDSIGTTVVDSSTEYEPVYSWNVSTNDDVGFYKVRLIANTLVRYPFTEFNCYDSTEFVVYILNDFLQFPNVVTPNGDGINDIFEIKNLFEGKAFTDNELYIYNHLGQMVYHKKNIATREDFWDPSLKNELEGAYYYRFSAKGILGNIQRNGVIQLIRGQK